MKILGWFFGFVTLVVVGVYGVVFTPFGNKLVQPYVQEQLQKQTVETVQLQKFQLSWGKIDLKIDLDSFNSVEVKGSFDIFKQSFALHYGVALEKLQNLEPLLNTKLQGGFATDGDVVGDIKKFEVDGKSDLAKSDTTYHIELEDLNPSSIIANIHALDLQTLLYMLNQKEYAYGKVDSDVNFKNITPHQLDGNIVVRSHNGVLNARVMRKDFGIKIPKTVFQLALDAQLKGDDVDYTMVLNSNLAKIASGGVVKPQPLDLKTHYKVDVKELAVLKPLTGADVRGALHLRGNVVGGEKKLVVDGKSDIASSKTTFKATLQNFQPHTLHATVRGLKLQKLLYMLKQPHYADGNVNLDVAMESLDMKNLKGTLHSQLSHGVLDTRYLTKEFAFSSPMPSTKFTLSTDTKLNKSLADTQVKLRSTLADINTQHTLFDLSDSSLETDYTLRVHKLSKLYFVTQRPLKGSITALGDVKKNKDLDVTMHSKVVRGVVDMKLHNDDVVVLMKGINSLAVLDMLVYPKVFDSTIDGDVKYNLASSQGKLTTKLTQGKFTKNQVLDATKKYAHIDLYKELFKGDVVADINKEKIVSSLDLRSNKSSIISKNAKIDTKKNTIDAWIDINANKHPLKVGLKGDISHPKLKIRAEKLIEQQATKALQKELKKHYGDDSEKMIDDAKKLFKGLF